MILRGDFVAVDPGKANLGLSVWQGGSLVWAGWPSVRDLPTIDGVLRVVVERPRARHPRETPGGVKGYQALIDIAFEGARYAGALLAQHNKPLVETVFPDEWKGGTSKKATEVYVVEQRAKKLLSPSELLRVELPSAASKAHNVWDAVGIGLFALGRAGRGLTRKGG